MRTTLQRAALRAMLVAACASVLSGAAVSAAAPAVFAEGQEIEGPKEPPVRGFAAPEVRDPPPKGPTGLL